MKVLAISTLIFLNYSAYAINCNDRQKYQLKAHITNEGLEKTLSIALGKSIPQLEDLIAKSVIPEFPLIVQPSEDCLNREKWEKMQVGESWKKCRGIPTLFYDQASTFKEGVKASPVMGVGNIQLDKPSIKLDKVQCEDMVCNIEFEISEFNIDGNLDIHDHFSGKRVLKLDHYRIKVDQEGEKLKGKFTVNIDPNDLDNAVFITDEFLNFDDKNRPKINLDVLDKRGRSAKPKAMMERLKDNVVKEFEVEIENNLAELKQMSEAQRQQWQDKVIDRLTKDIGNQYLQEQKEVFQSDLNEGSMALTSLLAEDLALDSRGNLLDGITSMVVSKTSKTLNIKLKDSIQKSLKNLPFIHQSFYQSLPSTSISDEYYHGVLADKHSDIKKRINKCQSKFEDGMRISWKKVKKECRLGSIKTFLDTLSNTAHEKNEPISNELIDLLQGLNDQLSSFQKRIPKKAIEKTQELINNAKLADKKLKRNVLKRKREYALKLAVVDISSSGEAIELFINACSAGCKEFNLLPINNDTIPPIDQNYHLAGSINLNSLNSVLNNIFEQKKLDLCTTAVAFKMCKKDAFFIGFGTQQNLNIKKAPQIKWDAKNNTLVLKIPEIERKQDILFPTSFLGNRDLTGLEVPFKLLPSKDGKAIAVDVDIKKLKSDFKIDGRSMFGPLILSVIQPYLGPAFLATHAAAHKVVIETKKDSIESVAETPIDISKSTPINSVVDIKANSENINIYMNLD